MLSLLLACSPPDPAPSEIEGLSHFFLTEYQLDNDTRLLEGAANLLTWYQDNVGEGDLGGTLGDLTREELDLLGMPADLDPAASVGVFHLIPQQCTPEQIDAIMLNDNQPELFEGTYESYARTHNLDKECYRSGECPHANWDIEIVSNLIGARMEYELNSGLIRASGEGPVPVATFMRTVMPEPAQVEGSFFFDQSYQAEAFVPMDDGNTLHLYALWNAGGHEDLDPELDGFKNQYFKGIEDWDLRIDELCADPSLYEE